jgi:hypothetical protein
MSAEHRAVARAGLLDIAHAHQADDWIVATGTSMLPTIRPGDRLLVSFRRPPERIGQVVVVERDSHRVAHRIVAIRPDDPAGGWIMKGDAESFADAPFHAGDVVGVVVGVARPSGAIRRRGFDGSSARWIARASRFGARFARRSRRLTGRLPGPIADLSLRILLPLTRVPTRLISAPMPWFDQETRAEGR